MTHNIEALRTWIRIVVLIASICATSSPIIYAFFPWRTRPIGRILMLQSIAFAVAMDLSLLFSFWHPKDILVVFWTDALVLTLIAAATAIYSLWMLKVYFTSQKDNNHEARQQGL